MLTILTPVNNTGGRPLYRAILGDMNTTGRRQLGLSRVTVSRALRQLARAGIRPRAAAVLDPAKIASAAGCRRDSR
jgi:hypothetical protein